MFSDKYVTQLIKRSNLTFPIQLLHKVSYYEDPTIYYVANIQELFQICYEILNKATLTSEFEGGEVPESLDEYASLCDEWQRDEYFYSVELVKLANQGLLMEKNSYVVDAKQRIENMQNYHNQALEDKIQYESVIKILEDKNGPQAFAAVHDFMATVTMVPMDTIIIDPEVVKDWV